MSVGTNLNNNDPLLFQDTVTITAGATVSNSINLQGRVLIGMNLPAAISGSSMTFQSSNDNVNFNALYNNENSAISVAYTQGRNYTISPDYVAGVKFLKLVSNNSQAASRAITVITRKID